MRYWVGVTDNEWFHSLQRLQPEDVNFWQPGGEATLKTIEIGAPFLFKLKSPLNAIGGVGFFSSNTVFPLNVAWEIFREKNGVGDFFSLKKKINSYRKDKMTVNPDIGCIVLTNPIFFEQKDWIEVPADWKSNIVSGRYYDTTDEIGAALWQKVEQRLLALNSPIIPQTLFDPSSNDRYSNTFLTKVRLGQSAFRVLVTDAYKRRCSISGEKTLPVLEAAHIQPYSQLGPHILSNSLLLRSDIHTLFDTGYITVTPDYRINVSSRIRTEFENGRDYYKFHGQQLQMLPSRDNERPGKEYLEFHNEKIFNG
jgi:putative restriction endonuclease